MDRKKMIAAGHICIDLTPVFGCGKQERIEHILSPGRLINVGNMRFHTGGAVSNTGLAMKLFGADAALMGKIGDDALGKLLLEELRAVGAGDGMILSPGQETSYSVVLAIPGVDRVFLHHSGANDTFSAADIDYELCREAVLFHFGYPSIMARMYREEGAELAKMFAEVKKCGCLTSLDMAAIDETSEAGRADWEAIFRKTLPYVDFFLPSFEELCFAIDRERYDELRRKADGRDMTEVISIEEDAAPLAEQVLEMGSRVVVIKCGASGFYYKTAEETAFLPLKETSGIDFSTFAGQEGFERSYAPEAVVSGTGAGDTMIAAFLTAMVSGYSFEKCRQLAAAAGACCVEAVDALSGLKTFPEMEQRMAAGWERTADGRL